MKRQVRVTFTVNVPTITNDDDPVASATALLLEVWGDTDLPFQGLRVEAVNE